MKKAIMQVSISSPTWNYRPGEEAILTDELAEAWEECGHAKIIGEVSDEEEQTHKDIELDPKSEEEIEETKIPEAEEEIEETKIPEAEEEIEETKIPESEEEIEETEIPEAEEEENAGEGEVNESESNNAAADGAPKPRRSKKTAQD